MLGRQAPLLRPVGASGLFSRLADTFSARKGIILDIDYEEAVLQCEAPLLISVLLNLTDNAYKPQNRARRSR